MTKNVYQTWVTKFIENVAEYFNFHEWKIKLNFSDEEDVDENEGTGTYASTNISTTYMNAEITVFKQGRLDFEAGNFETLIGVLTHELVHIFLDPFTEAMHPHLSKTTAPFFMNILENQTQKLTMVFCKNLPKELIPPIPTRKPNGKHNTTSKNDKSRPTVYSAVPADVLDKHS